MHLFARFPYLGAAACADLVASLVPTSGRSKLARSFAERAGTIEHVAAWSREHRSSDGPLLWMHAPSVGEGLMARPVLDHARRVTPSMQQAYTWFSPSATRFAGSLAVDVSGMLPFDTPGNAEAMLDALRPSLVAFTRADVWPVLTEHVARRQVPVALLSAALSAGSSRGLWSRWILADAYGALDVVGAVDDADAERLVALGARRDRVHVTGDTRYDQVLARAMQADRTGVLLTPLDAGSEERPWVVAGSTWPADEAVLFDAWQRLARAGRGARLLVAPHEPTEAHCRPIEQWAAGAGLALARLGAPAVRDADVVLVDRVGVLGDLYAVARVAYVGGGFHRAGLHSVVEPAAFGVPVLVGPQGTRSRDALRLIDAGGASRVADADALFDALRAALADRAATVERGASARAVVEAGRGATLRSWALLEPLLASRAVRRP